MVPGLLHLAVTWFSLCSAVLSLRYYAGFSVVAESEGYSLVEGRVLVAVASFMAEHGLQGMQASVVAALGL